MSTLIKNLNYLMKQHGLSANQLQEKTGVTQSTTSRILKGETKNPRLDALQKYADYFGVSIADLQFTDLPTKTRLENQQIVDDLIASMPNGITHDQIEPWRNQTWVEVYDLKFCCGDGGGYAEFEPLKKTLPFDNSFFKYRNIKPEFFKLIYGKGDSMSPYINDGDAVGLDISDKIPKDGEVYALFLDGDTMIKRIFREAGGVLRLTSDNKAYRDKVVDDSNGDSLIIIGRVVYRSG